MRCEINLELQIRELPHIPAYSTRYRSKKYRKILAHKDFTRFSNLPTTPNHIKVLLLQTQKEL